MGSGTAASTSASPERLPSCRASVLDGEASIDAGAGRVGEGMWDPRHRRERRGGSALQPAWDVLVAFVTVGTYSTQRKKPSG